jgi:hypothetical protein
MFDLEQSIMEWRRQMLAAGIKTPVPLEELESHLRMEIDRQIQAGASDEEAFQRTVLQMGPARDLKAEFAKTGNFLTFLGNAKFTIIHRILGILWLVHCSLGFFGMSREIILHLAHGRHGGLLMGLLFWAVYGAGIGGSILVIRGAKPGRWMVGTLAGLFALFSLCILLRLITAVQVFSVVKVSIFTAFYVVTACLMFLPSPSNIEPARK